MFLVTTNIQITCILVLYNLTVAAFIAAVNSRGTARIILSYIFAVIILIISISVTFQYNYLKKIERQKQIAARLKETIDQNDAFISLSEHR